MHALRRATQILGEWEFRLGESDGDSTATCGHGAPDRVMTAVHAGVSPAHPNFDIKRTLTLELKNPDVVVGPDGRHGRWTTIYDEAIEVELDGWNVRGGLQRRTPPHAHATRARPPARPRST